MDVNRSSFILEEQVNDLENRLFHKCQALKTKEHVLHMQQEQIRKLEDMYKKSLEDYAVVSGEHKKTLNDLENLRIILKSYEAKGPCTNNTQTQVDFLPPPFEKCRRDTETSPEKCHGDFQRIRASVELQNQKADYIIQFLNEATSTQLNIIRAHIEDLEKCTHSLVSMNRNPSDLPVIPEEPQQGCSTKSKHFGPDQVMILENACQTNITTKDAHTNVPHSVKCLGSQAEVCINHLGTVTECAALASKTTQCHLQQYPSISIQSTLYDEIFTLKHNMQSMVASISTSEEIYNKLEDCVRINQTLAEAMQKKEAELSEATQKCYLLDALIKRNSLQTTQEITELCRKVTLQTSDNYREILQENANLKEKVDMLKNEAENLKLHHSEISRVVVELVNAGMQTDVCMLSVSAEEYRKQVVDLSDELATSYITIKSLQNKLNQVEKTSDSLEQLKDVFLKMNTENALFYNRQLAEVENRHSERARLLEEQITDMQKHGHEDHRVSVLKMENSELCKVIFDLKHELELAKISQNSADDLKLMCLKLGENISDTTAIKQENVQLKNKITSNEVEVDLIQNHYTSEIQNLAEEIRKLNEENQELSEGVNQLKLIVQLNSEIETNSQSTCMNDKSRVRNVGVEAESSPDSDTTMEDLVVIPRQVQMKKTKKIDSHSSDLIKLIHLSESLSTCIKTKNEIGIHGGDKAMLSNLEKEIQALTKEFMNFKWCSQAEHQKLVQKHAELLAHKEELVNCLNQYKTVNENLLQSHYELEKSKNVSATQHQHLLEEYLKLQAELQHFVMTAENKKDRGDCTILSLRDIRDFDYLKIENQDLQNLNLKLQNEIQNLLEQIQSDQNILTFHKNHQINEKCPGCEKLITENLKLKNAILQKEENLALSLNKCQSLQNESNMMAQIKDELSKIRELHRHDEKHNEQLAKQLNALALERENLLKDIDKYEAKMTELIDELNKTQHDLKDALQVKEDYCKDLEYLRADIKASADLMAELAKTKKNMKTIVDEKDKLAKALEKVQENLKNAESELARSQEEVNMLHKVVNKMAAYKEKFYKLETETTELRSELLQKNMTLRYNDSLQEDYKALVDQLKIITDSKEKVELDFESYIRTNNLLQATMNTQNCNITEELRIFQNECERLRGELSQMEGAKANSKNEYLRVVNECDNYKNQLENMTKRIDCHLREHVEYRKEMEESKRRLENEIASLKQLIKMPSKPSEKLLGKSCHGEKGIIDLETFISNKDVEIDLLMGQKMEAMEVMGSMASVSGAGKSTQKGGLTSETSEMLSSESIEDFKVHLNFKKATRELSSGKVTKVSTKGSRSTSEPRAASKVTWEKDPKTGMQPSNSRMRKPIVNLAARKK